MHSPKFLAFVAALIACGTVSIDRADAMPARSTFCVDASSPTASIDRAVAGAAGRAMRVPVTIAPYDGSTGVSEGFFRFLARTHCALIMGYPVDSVAPDPPDGLALTRSYFESGYVVAALDRGLTQRSIRPGTAVAIVTGTPPNFYLAGALGPQPPFHADAYATPEEALDALVARTDPAAMVWEPSVIRYRAIHPHASIVTAPLSIAHARWQFAALFGERDGALGRRFNAAIATLAARGELVRFTRRLRQGTL